MLAITDWMAIFGTIFLVMGSVWGIGRWLDARFYSTQNMLLTKMERMQEVILGKLDYHEKHDDQRFSAVNNDLWELRVRNAATDGRATEDRKASVQRDKLSKAE